MYTLADSMAPHGLEPIRFLVQLVSVPSAGVRLLFFDRQNRS
jgi:hypothetical protein